MTNKESLAGFLATRGHCLLDIGRAVSAYSSYRAAVWRQPDQPHYHQFMQHAQTKAHPHLLDTSFARVPRRPGQSEWDHSSAEIERIKRINAENQRRQEEEWRRIEQLHQINNQPSRYVDPFQPQQPHDPFAPPHQGF